ncbi:MAG TPA: ABC transporter permease [Pseudonocardiaceae bacterium]|nr:ABC transporter permease [Pseudonocardiaceae bacterium]
MTLIATERIKLFTTRSPWWSMLLALVLSVGFASLIAANVGTDNNISISEAEGGYQFSLVVMMVMAALAVTTEYRFGTIRVSFQAVPNRVALLLSKTAVVAVLAAIVGEVTAFASWAVARLIHPSTTLALSNEAAWRGVAGMGLVYAITAVIAVGVGILIRQTAGAVAILLIYSLLVENLVVLIPKIGQTIQKWMPFTEANNFLVAGTPNVARRGLEGMPLSAWGSLAYFAGIAAVIMIIALFTANRRDA